MTIDEAVGARIRAQRDRLGIPRSELAAQLGTTETSLYRWETGRRPVDLETLCRLAEALGVPPASLLDGVAEAPKTRKRGRR